MIKVLIIDDHPIVRKGLRQLLEDDGNDRFGMIEEAGNGKEMFEKLVSENYDIILLDISLPGRNGLELLEEIKRTNPKIAVLILSIYSEEQYAVRAIKLGASGYLNKASAPDELIKAISKVSMGGTYISSSLAQNVTIDLFQGRGKRPSEFLSSRELQVIGLLASGKTISNIGKELSLSPKTISTYRERILSKLKLKTTSDIIRYAIKERLIED
jgi:two-component system, NarL family, invasion response regulator UvrY